MVTLRQRGVSPTMAIDASGVWPSAAGRRGSITSYKFRVREERKKVIRISNAKYRTIEDHESGLRRFVLIRNTLRRLQREAREEKLARHRAGATNVSPSYLSASRPRSPSPPCDMQVSDVLSVYGQPTPTPISALEDDDPLPSPKRPRLFLDDDKENERESCESRLMECDKDDSRLIVDDTQEILRDLYETYTGESISAQPRPSTPTPPRPDTPFATPAYSCTLPTTTTPSLTSSINTSSSSTTTTNNNNNSSSYTSSYSSSMGSGSSSYHDWGRTQQQQYACGHASLLGNDLQSVVFHSLIASLES